MSSKKIRVAINGAGRIGRAFLKLALQREELEVVAINDLGDIDNIAYLLSFDSAYGRSGLKVSSSSDKKFINISGQTADEAKESGFNSALIYQNLAPVKIAYVSEKEPLKLPWKDYAIDIVIESTGFFTSYEKAYPHIVAGAKRVVISAPVKDEAGPTAPIAATILIGINEDRFHGNVITSNASCTTNSASPLMAILDEAIGIEKAVLNTVHGYTASQSLVDGPNKKDWKEGRAAAHNIVPTSTGAAQAVAKALPQLEGKFDGISMRVPVIAGSIADIVFISKRNTTVEEINDALTKAAADLKWKGIFTVSKDKLVSGDILGSAHASIADLGLTRVVDGNLVKVCAWYDNEMGYTHALIEHTVRAGKFL